MTTFKAGDRARVTIPACNDRVQGRIPARKIEVTVLEVIKNDYFTTFPMGELMIVTSRTGKKYGGYPVSRCERV